MEYELLLLESNPFQSSSIRTPFVQSGLVGEFLEKLSASQSRCRRLVHNTSGRDWKRHCPHSDDFLHSCQIALLKFQPGLIVMPLMMGTPWRFHISQALHCSTVLPSNEPTSFFGLGSRGKKKEKREKNANSKEMQRANKHIPPRKWTNVPLKRNHFNRELVFPPSFFGGHVSFREGKSRVMPSTKLSSFPSMLCQGTSIAWQGHTLLAGKPTCHSTPPSSGSICEIPVKTETHLKINGVYGSLWSHLKETLSSTIYNIYTIYTIKSSSFSSSSDQPLRSVFVKAFCAAPELHRTTIPWGIRDFVEFRLWGSPAMDPLGGITAFPVFAAFPVTTFQ